MNNLAAGIWGVIFGIFADAWNILVDIVYFISQCFGGGLHGLSESEDEVAKDEGRLVQFTYEQRGSGDGDGDCDWGRYWRCPGEYSIQG